MSDFGSSIFDSKPMDTSSIDSVPSVVGSKGPKSFRQALGEALANAMPGALHTMAYSFASPTQQDIMQRGEQETADRAQRMAEFKQSQAQQESQFERGQAQTQTLASQQRAMSLAAQSQEFRIQSGQQAIERAKMRNESGMQLLNMRSQGLLDDNALDSIEPVFSGSDMGMGDTIKALRNIPVSQAPEQWNLIKGVNGEPTGMSRKTTIKGITHEDEFAPDQLLAQFPAHYATLQAFKQSWQKSSDDEVKKQKEILDYTNANTENRQTKQFERAQQKSAEVEHDKYSTGLNKELVQMKALTDNIHDAAQNPTPTTTEQMPYWMQALDRNMGGGLRNAQQVSDLRAAGSLSTRAANLINHWTSGKQMEPGQMKDMDEVAQTMLREKQKNVNQSIEDHRYEMNMRQGVNIPPSTIQARDANGKLHEAKPGTPLPKGWTMVK